MIVRGDRVGRLSFGGTMLLAGVGASLVMTACSSTSSQSTRAAVENAATASPQVMAAGGYPACVPPSDKNAKQTVCVYVDNAAQRFTDTSGSLGVLNLVDPSTAYGKNNHDGFMHSDPSPPTTIGAEQAYYRYYQTHITDDADVHVTYNAAADVYPATESVVMWSFNPNTGDNKASCSGGKYTACQVTDSNIPTGGETVNTPFRVVNLPLSIQVQNNLTAPLDQVGSANMSKFVLDSAFGTPGKSVASKASAYWQGYREQSPKMDNYPVPVPSPSTGTSPFNSVQVKYTVGGTSSLAGSQIAISAQVDEFGNPSASTCTVTNTTSYSQLFCDLSEAGSSDNPIALTANIHQ